MFRIRSVRGLRTFLLIFGLLHTSNSQTNGFPERIGCTNTATSTTCYDAFNATVTWTDAWARCAAANGQLALMTTPEANGLIGGYADHMANDLEGDFSTWIGGHELSVSNWQWIGGQSFQYGGNDSKTVVNLSSQVKPFETCAAVVSNGSSPTLFFQSLQCSSTAFFICQSGNSTKRTWNNNSTSNSTTCQIGQIKGVVRGNSCYAAVSSPNPVTWFQARYECIKNGADLAVFDESRDHDVIISLLPAGSQNTFWIGLRRYPWIWATSYNPVNQMVDQWQDMAYAQWGASSPNYNGRSCLAMKGQGGPGHGWVNLGCNETHTYICQQTTFVTTTTAAFSPIYIDVNLTDSSGVSSPNGDRIAKIVVPCAIVAVIIIIIGFTIYCYFSKRKGGYDQH